MVVDGGWCAHSGAPDLLKYVPQQVLKALSILVPLTNVSSSSVTIRKRDVMLGIQSSIFSGKTVITLLVTSMAITCFPEVDRVVAVSETCRAFFPIQVSSWRLAIFQWLHWHLPTQTVLYCSLTSVSRNANFYDLHDYNDRHILSTSIDICLSPTIPLPAIADTTHPVLFAQQPHHNSSANTGRPYSSITSVLFPAPRSSVELMQAISSLTLGPFWL